MEEREILFGTCYIDIFSVRSINQPTVPVSQIRYSCFVAQMMVKIIKIKANIDCLTYLADIFAHFHRRNKEVYGNKKLQKLLNRSVDNEAFIEKIEMDIWED